MQLLIKETCFRYGFTIMDEGKTIRRPACQHHDDDLARIIKDGNDFKLLDFDGNKDLVRPKITILTKYAVVMDGYHDDERHNAALITSIRGEKL